MLMTNNMKHELRDSGEDDAVVVQPVWPVNEAQVKFDGWQLQLVAMPEQ